MSKFTLHWSEYHNPLNWGKTEQSGIRAMKQLLPAKKIYLDPYENDGWVVCECELTAKILDQAIKLAKANCIGNGVDVFSIYKDNNYSEPVFTEENLE